MCAFSDIDNGLEVRNQTIISYCARNGVHVSLPIICIHKILSSFFKLKNSKRASRHTSILLITHWRFLFTQVLECLLP